MATAPRQAIAAPSIFSTDPIEQIYGKGVISGDPTISGFAGAMLNAANTARERDQGTYLTNLAESNKLSALLSQQAERGETLREAMKQVPHYANAGLQIADFPSVGQVASDPNSPSVRLPATLHNAETQAKINKLNAEATAKFGEGGPKLTTRVITNQYGTGEIEYKVVGGTPQTQQAVIDEANRRGVRARGQTDPGPSAPLRSQGQINPSGTSNTLPRLPREVTN